MNPAHLKTAKIIAGAALAADGVRRLVANLKTDQVREESALSWFAPNRDPEEKKAGYGLAALEIAVGAFLVLKA